MILHLSKQLSDRLKCPISMKGVPIIQAGRLDAWSGHCFRIGRIEHVILMNDASLYTILIPAKGLTSLEAFLKAFLPRVADAWQQFGAEFDSQNQEFVVLKRANRSLIGSMNDAIQAAKFHHYYAQQKHEGYGDMDIETRLNMVLYKALAYETPSRLLQKLLTGS